MYGLLAAGITLVCGFIVFGTERVDGRLRVKKFTAAVDDRV
jgi:hypothetical protein